MFRAAGLDGVLPALVRGVLSFKIGFQVGLSFNLGNFVQLEQGFVLLFKSYLFSVRIKVLFLFEGLEVLADVEASLQPGVPLLVVLAEFHRKILDPAQKLLCRDLFEIKIRFEGRLGVVLHESLLQEKLVHSY